MGGLGGLVDISSPTNILIAPFSGVPGVLQLDPRDLSTFGADSLLIGGFRQSNSDGAMVTVTTPNIAVDISGSPDGAGSHPGGKSISNAGRRCGLGAAGITYSAC